MWTWIDKHKKTEKIMKKELQIGEIMNRKKVLRMVNLGNFKSSSN